MSRETERRKRLAKEFRETKKLSRLLLIAVADLETIKKDKRFKLEMGTWFRREREVELKPVRKPICEVCMAGAVMACRLFPLPEDLAVDVHLDPSDFGQKLDNKLSAINEMREGNFSTAAGYIGLQVSERQEVACDEAGAVIQRRFNHFGSELAPISVYKKAAKILAKARL